MSGYLERLVRRARGRAGAAALRPRGDARSDGELTGAPPAEGLEEVVEERPAASAALATDSETLASSSRSREADPAAGGTAPGRNRPAAAVPAARLLAAAEVPGSGPAARTAGSEAVARVAAPTPEPPIAPEPAAAPMPSPAHTDPPEPSGPPATTESVATRAVTTSPRRSPAGRRAAARLGLAAIEAPVVAAVTRRLAALEPPVAPPWAALRFGGVRFDSDGEPRIEVHIDRLEVVQPTPPPPPPAALPPRPRHRGFADLAETRGHARRRWC